MLGATGTAAAYGPAVVTVEVQPSQPAHTATVVLVGIFVVQGHITGRYVLDQPIASQRL
jgi:hypothetical protein